MFDADGTLVQKGKVLIAPVDAKTGVILTSRGIAFATADPVDLTITKNGPEWGCTSKKCALYFTSYLPDRSGGRLAKLEENTDGSWSVRFLPGGEDKMSHIPSLDPSSSDPPKIYYGNVQGLSETSLDTAVYGWRADERPAVDHVIRRGSTPARWAPGSDDLILMVSVKTRFGLVEKLARFDTGTRTTEILIEDSKVRQQPFPWLAPEFDGELAISTLVHGDAAGHRFIEILRRGRTGEWEVYREIRSPDPNYPYLDSPEPIIFRGRSYVSFAAFQAQETDRILPSGSSTIWIASIDGKFVRKVSVETRADYVTPKHEPEALAIRGGTRLVVYYNDGVVGGKRTLKVCQTGL
ncbi:MAG TPA: hypothetical protein VEQ63_07350 [Bryobacteraceae bacterium]|nr:hypothetical protein [Bryobacteraceae bacterium]